MAAHAADAGMPAPPSLLISRYQTFALLSLIYLVAATVNHIDDTDETYGYWEPLHYLLYGTGMQHKTPDGVDAEDSA